MVSGMGKHSRSETYYPQAYRPSQVVPVASSEYRPKAVRNSKKPQPVPSYGASERGLQTESPEPLNEEQQELLTWLKTMKFKRARFGGVSEEDVWKKISELNRRYDACLRAERARYDALLESRGIREWPNA